MSNNDKLLNYITVIAGLIIANVGYGLCSSTGSMVEAMDRTYFQMTALFAHFIVGCFITKVNKLNMSDISPRSSED